MAYRTVRFTRRLIRGFYGKIIVCSIIATLCSISLLMRSTAENPSSGNIGYLSRHPAGVVYPAISPERLLHLFTTWIPEPNKTTVHRNTMKIWASYKPEIMPIVFANNQEVLEAAAGHDWIRMPITHHRCGGVPTLKSMFTTVQAKFNSHFYGYSNSDILFHSGLVRTLRMLSQNALMDKVPILMVGRRTNVDITNTTFINNTEDIKNIALKKGELFLPVAMDYFITNRLFPWDRIPPMVVGRGSVDNFLMCMARKINVTIIDISNTVLAVHQTTEDGNYAGLKRNYKTCNAILMYEMKLEAIFHGNMERGQTECASLYSAYDYNGHIQLMSRPALHPDCYVGIDNKYHI